MIIMHPDHVVSLGRFQNRFTKSIVDSDVRVPLGLIVFSVLGEVVEEGPNRFIAESFVVLFDVARGKEDGLNILGAQLCFDLILLSVVAN